MDPAIVALAAASLVATALLARRLVAPYVYREPVLSRRAEIVLIIVASGAVAAASTGQVVAAAVSTVLLVVLGLAVARIIPRLTGVGAVLTSLPLASMLVAAPWGYLWLAELGYPSWFLKAYLAGAAIGAVAMPYTFLVGLAQSALFTHASWRLPTAPLSGPGREPMVSIHLPCHAEPPDVVAATLDALQALDYPNFEVLVCDNNTSDPKLWVPVRDYCTRLNESAGREVFRFFHVEGLDGAKAGALNFCLKRTAEEAELIALVDADYIARPDFLSSLVGFFKDAAVGFVQTSHDYRGFEGSAFKAMCYREYMPTYKVAMPSVNEYHGAFTIGTMCLFRRTGLEAVGGWAEWCLTEDSEIAVRLRAAGADGVYLRDTFGRGLIPEHFSDFKKQRFRWTAGPIQQLRRHWPFLLPSIISGRRSRMKPWSMVLELQHSLSELSVLGIPLALLAAPAFGALMISDVLPTIQLPPAAWIALALTAMTQVLRTILTCRLAGQRTLWSILGGMVARQSLLLVRVQAVIAGLVSSRPLVWRRTPKFAATSGSLGRIVASSWAETLIAAGAIAAATLPYIYAEALGPHATALGSIGLASIGLRFLCAPLVATVCELEIAGVGRRLSRILALARSGQMPARDGRTVEVSFRSAP